METLLRKREVKIKITEELNVNSVRTSWSRYKRKIASLPAMSNLVENMTLSIQVTEGDIMELKLRKKVPQYQIIPPALG